MANSTKIIIKTSTQVALSQVKPRSGNRSFFQRHWKVFLIETDENRETVLKYLDKGKVGKGTLCCLGGNLTYCDLARG